MSKPVVAIVGRPNTGKSTLFNKLVGRRMSIVDDTPGVTRDRIFGESEWLGRKFTLIDTGGIEPKTDDVILAQMRRQAQLAIDSADVIVMVVDQRSGVVASDQDVAAMLRRSSMSFITWASGIRLPSPRSTVTARGICWTPCWHTVRPLPRRMSARIISRWP